MYAMSQLEPTCQKGIKIGRYKSRQIPEFKVSYVGYGNFRTGSLSEHFYNIKKKNVCLPAPKNQRAGGGMGC